MNKKSVAIFCGASGGSEDKYSALATELIFEIHQRKMQLVYGGANIGLMGKFANEMIRIGGDVIGVIPQSLCIKEVVHEHLKDLRIVKSMHERKELMYQLSDAFFILPGGMGTLDEFFEILTWKQLAHHQKPIMIINFDGYFDHLIAWMDHAVQSGFIKSHDKKLFHVINDIRFIPWGEIDGTA